MWEMIKKLADSGTTILLTTQYMEEADVLAGRIAIIDGDRKITFGELRVMVNKIAASWDELDCPKGGTIAVLPLLAA